MRGNTPLNQRVTPEEGEKKNESRAEIKNTQRVSIMEEPEPEAVTQPLEIISSTLGPARLLGPHKKLKALGQH